MMSSPSPGHPSKLRVWPEARDCLCVLALAAFVTWSCERARPSTEAPQNGVVTEAQATETSAAPAPELVCELERERFVLLDGRWQRECLAEPIPRDSSIWTSDGHRVALLANAGCEDTEEQTVFVLRGEELSRVPLHLEQRIGRGGAITFLDDDLLLVPGESCEGPTLGLIVHRLNLATASVESHKHFSRSAELWPSIAKNGERIGIPLGFDDVFGMLTGTLPLPRAYCGCLHLWPVNPEYAMCCTPGFYQPDGSGVSVTWQSSTQMKELFEGRGLTWAQDLITGRMLYVAGIRTPDSKYYQGEFILSSHAWSLHEYQPARRLPIPPVMGDGVQLLFDADRGQMILLDPASTRSWLLEKDYRRWLPLEHEPLAALAEQLGTLEEVPSSTEPLDPLRTPPSRAELDAKRPPIWRNTDHLAPWFASYDLERHAIVLYPYRPKGVFCLPVQGRPGETVCLASHS